MERDEQPSCTNRADACDPNCAGWFWSLSDRDGWVIERCDECARFADDDGARDHLQDCRHCYETARDQAGDRELQVAGVSRPQATKIFHARLGEPSPMHPFYSEGALYYRGQYIGPIESCHVESFPAAVLRAGRACMRRQRQSLKYQYNLFGVPGFCGAAK